MSPTVECRSISASACRWASKRAMTAPSMPASMTSAATRRRTGRSVGDPHFAHAALANSGQQGIVAEGAAGPTSARSEWRRLRPYRDQLGLERSAAECHHSPESADPPAASHRPRHRIRRTGLRFPDDAIVHVEDVGGVAMTCAEVMTRMSQRLGWELSPKCLPMAPAAEHDRFKARRCSRSWVTGQGPRIPAQVSQVLGPRTCRGTLSVMLDAVRLQESPGRGAIKIVQPR